MSDSDQKQRQEAWTFFNHGSDENNFHESRRKRKNYENENFPRPVCSQFSLAHIKSKTCVGVRCKNEIKREIYNKKASNGLVLMRIRSSIFFKACELGKKTNEKKRRQNTIQRTRFWRSSNQKWREKQDRREEKNYEWKKNEFQSSFGADHDEIFSGRFSTFLSGFFLEWRKKRARSVHVPATTLTTRQAKISTIGSRSSWYRIFLFSIFLRFLLLFSC